MVENSRMRRTHPPLWVPQNDIKVLSNGDFPLSSKIKGETRPAASGRVSQTLQVVLFWVRASCLAVSASGCLATTPQDGARKQLMFTSADEVTCPPLLVCLFVYKWDFRKNGWLIPVKLVGTMWWGSGKSPLIFGADLDQGFYFSRPSTLGGWTFFNISSVYPTGDNSWILIKLN